MDKDMFQLWKCESLFCGLSVGEDRRPWWQAYPEGQLQVTIEQDLCEEEAAMCVGG